MPPAPEYRHDPISGRTVIVARGRGERPHDFRQRIIERVDRPCPFCRGHERDTPAALATYGEDETGDWLVRVIPNKYPALATFAHTGRSVPAEGLDVTVDADAGPAFIPFAGHGAHEVIVESPRHVVCFSQLEDREAIAAVRAYRDRLRLHSQDPSLRYAQLFKNTGHDAGASVEHAHSQLMATAFLPAEMQRELRRSNRHLQSHGLCIFCDLLAREMDQRVRIVSATDRFVALCPFAGRFPYEAWILPRRHEPSFERLDDTDLTELGPLLRNVVAGVIGAAQQPAYNYFLHTAPFDTDRCDHYHWHIEMFPRTNEVGGFEWATGCFINSIPPEKAAAAIKSRAQTFPTGKAS
jgi:UDPglucose--hexose-1-phosphate uridylyltransferase